MARPPELSLLNNDRVTPFGHTVAAGCNTGTWPASFQKNRTLLCGHVSGKYCHPWAAAPQYDTTYTITAHKLRHKNGTQNAEHAQQHSVALFEFVTENFGDASRT